MLSVTHIYQETLNLQPFNKLLHFIYMSAPWMPHNIGLLHMNIPYGTPQLQHYSSGWQISKHTLPVPEEILFSHFMTTLNSTFETEFAQENVGYEGGSENFNIHTLLCRTLRIYHMSTREAFSFNPAVFNQTPTTPEHHDENSPHRYRHCSFTCH